MDGTPYSEADLDNLQVYIVIVIALCLAGLYHVIIVLYYQYLIIAF